MEFDFIVTDRVLSLYNMKHIIVVNGVVTYVNGVVIYLVYIKVGIL